MPGTSAIITPFCKTSGLYFDESHEPEDFKFILDKDINETLCQKEDCVNISPSFDSVEAYYDFTITNGKHHKDIKMEHKEKKDDMYTIEIIMDDDEIED